MWEKKKNDLILHYHSARNFPVVTRWKRNLSVTPTCRAALPYQTHPEGILRRTLVAVLRETKTRTDVSPNMYPIPQHSANRYYCINTPSPYESWMTLVVRSEHNVGPVTRWKWNQISRHAEIAKHLSEHGDQPCHDFSTYPCKMEIYNVQRDVSQWLKGSYYCTLQQVKTLGRIIPGAASCLGVQTASLDALGSPIEPSS